MKTGCRRSDGGGTTRGSKVVVSMAMRSSSGVEEQAGRGNDVPRTSCFACAIFRDGGGLDASRDRQLR
jgi:hypothetical protein